MIHDSSNDTGDIDLERMIEENYDAVYRYCYWKLRNVEDAQDITQEVFYRFINHRDSYREEGRIRAYLYRIARNLCINWGVQNKKYKKSELTENILASDSMESLIIKMDLKQLTDTLPEKQKEILLLRFGQELSVAEIAEVLDMNRFGVYYQMKLALAKLRHYYERE